MWPINVDIKIPEKVLVFEFLKICFNYSGTLTSPGCCMRS